jgi:hypothetical protein
MKELGGPVADIEEPEEHCPHHCHEQEAGMMLVKEKPASADTSVIAQPRIVIMLVSSAPILC